jgi:polyisoprenoid-binding protein YceI
VQFTYSHLGFSNITGRFDQVQGDFRFDVADPTQSSVSITIPVQSISTGVDKLDEHLLKADFFDATQFPTATFTSTGVTAAGEGKLAVAGDLTIHGVTRPVVLDVTINKIGEHPMRKRPAAGFDARATLKRSDFGVGAYVPMVGDEVTLSITVEAFQAE